MAKGDVYQDPFPDLPRKYAIERQFADNPEPLKSPKKAKRVMKRAEAVAKPLAKPKQARKPRAEYEGSSLSKQQPWKAEGLSRAAWYRKQRDRA